MSDITSERPNIVIINADDLGYGDLGCYGATKVKTPNIDKIAAEGRRFTDAHAASAVCSPSRYGLMTGEYPLRRNFWGPTSSNALSIDPAKTTLASVLKSSGYSTAIFGKWHLGFQSEGETDWNQPLKPGPLDVGFDHYFGVPIVNSIPPYVYVEDEEVVGYDPEDPFVKGEECVTQKWPEKGSYNEFGGAKKAHELYRDEWVGTTLAEKSTQWIEKVVSEKKGRPFFLYLATLNIHHPFTPAPHFKGTSECGIYGDFIHEFDWIVGEVVKALEKTGQTENTLLIVTSDNGGMLNASGQEAWKSGHRLCGDLLGFKFDAWEGGHRVPFVAKWPGRIPAGDVSDELISQVDLLATVASIAGTKVPEGDGRDSLNQLETLTGNPEKSVRTQLLICPNSPKHLSLRQGEEVYIPAQDAGGFQGKEVGEHLLGGGAAFKLTKEKHSDFSEEGELKEGAPEVQLYNLKDDPRQKKNLAKEQPLRVKELQRVIDEYRDRIEDYPRLGWINLQQD